LLIGKRNQTSIATLVERTTGYAMLVLQAFSNVSDHARVAALTATHH
jgi:hypothetical protein